MFDIIVGTAVVGVLAIMVLLIWYPWDNHDPWNDL